MTLADALQRKTKVAGPEFETVFIEGQIESDSDPKYFRLYPNGSDRNRYYFVNKTDVQGDIYQWTADEIIQRGFTGQERYRISVKADALLGVITVTVKRASELESCTPGDCRGGTMGCTCDRCTDNGYWVCDETCCVG
jgi:hypothetical protein